jgi:hypothetical protein
MKWKEAEGEDKCNAENVKKLYHGNGGIARIVLQGLNGRYILPKLLLLCW